MVNKPENRMRQSWIKNDSLMAEKLKPVSDALFESIGIPEGRKFLDIRCGGGYNPSAWETSQPYCVGNRNRYLLSNNSFRKRKS